MWFQSWVNALCSRTQNQRSRRDRCSDRRRPQMRRLLVEGLEDRRLMTFTPAGSYVINATPSVIATADFNNDGNLDLATCANAVTGSVSVLLGNGAGGFGAAQRTIVGSQLSSLLVADFNNDTRPDMLVSDPYNGPTALIGNGDGTFQPAVRLNLIGGAGKDVGALGRSSHGSTELLVTWLGADWQTYVQVYAGNLQGGFTAGQESYYWGNGGMAPVDLNNDGHLDVATGDGVVFQGGINQSLQFDHSQSYPLTGGAVATGDFTGDGNADVIVAGSSVAVLRGKGDGSLHAPIHHSANGSRHTAVATADFNADGKLDAVVSGGDLGTASVMLGNGDGTLRYAGAFATGSSATGVVVGDFNRDGLPDVAVSNAGTSRNISVLLNDGDWEEAPPALPILSISDTTVSEGNAGTVNATFTVTLSSASAETVTVEYIKANGTATAGSDYQAAIGTLVIPAGQTTGTITVLVSGDRLAEATETFFVNLSSPTNAVINDGQGVGTIVDDEPRISISDVSKSEGRKNQTTLLTFTVTLSAAYDQPVTMSYRTVNGTATTGNSDYVAKTGTLTFAPGQTTKTITIEVKGDSKREAHETFYLDLFGNSSNSQFTKNRGLGTILNDD